MSKKKDNKKFKKKEVVIQPTPIDVDKLYDHRKDETVNVGGRPSKYLADPDYYDGMVVVLMAEGMDKAMAGVHLGVTPVTLWMWMNKGDEAHDTYDPEYKRFFNAIKDGEIFRQLWWEEQGRLNLHNQKFNAVLWLMHMKNLFRGKLDVLRGEGWMAKDHVVIEGSLDHNHKHSVEKIDLNKLGEKELVAMSVMLSKAIVQKQNTSVTRIAG